MKFLTEEHALCDSALFCLPNLSWPQMVLRCSALDRLLRACVCASHFHVVLFIPVSQSKPSGEPFAHPKARRPKQTAPNKVVTGTPTGFPSNPCSRSMNWRSITAAWPYRPPALMGKRNYDMLTFNQTDWWGERLLLEVEFIQFHLLIWKCFFLILSCCRHLCLMITRYTHIHTHTRTHGQWSPLLAGEKAALKAGNEFSLSQAIPRGCSFSVWTYVCCGSWDICDALLWFTDTIKKNSKKTKTNKTPVCHRGALTLISGSSSWFYGGDL